MGLTKLRAHQLLDIDFKQSARVITTTNIVLNGGAPSTVDGVSLARGDRVLVTGQSTTSQNGIYRVSSLGTGNNGIWVRAQDADTTGDMTSGLMIAVTEGTSYADTRWKLSTPDPITIGSTGLSFSQLSTAVGNNAFGNIAVAGQSNVVADQIGDLLTLASGNNIVVTTNATTDTITLAVADSPSFSGYVSALGGDSNNSSLVLDGYNQRGGVGYHGFLEVTNTYGSATNPSKHFRINSTGGMEIINSAYSAVILTLSDNGQLDVPALVVAGNIGANTIVVTNGLSAGSINSTPIGNATPGTGAFTTLTASSTVTLSPTSADVNLSPTVLGKVTIAPNTTGSINNMIIGNATARAGTFTTLTSTSTTSLGATSATAINSTPIGNSTASTGAFTTLSASSTVTLSPTSADVTLSPGVGGKVVIDPGITGSINNMVIGNTTARGGTFTTLTSSSTTSLGATSATAINNTPIGNATASSGVFTTLTADTVASTNNGNGTNFKVGDDAWIGDVNVADTIRISGLQNGNNAYIIFGAASGDSLGRAGTGALTYTSAFTAQGGIQNTPIGNATPNSGAFTSLTANGAVTLTQNTASTSTSSGTLVVTGGTGISGNAYVGGNLVVTGNLTINGTTTTVNSTTTTLDDPIFTLGGDTAPSSDDNKDRGIEFRWHNGSAAKVGFFGYDDSTGRFTFIPDATNTSEVFSGTVGNAQFSTVYATTLSSGSNATAGTIEGDWTLTSGSTFNATYADLAEKYLADNDYPTGTVVTVGGNKEVTRCQVGTRAIGAISAEPAFVMNKMLENGSCVALKGRVPVLVTGPVAKGDRMIAGPNGYAISALPSQYYDTFAIALETNQNPDSKLVECLIL